MLRSLRTFTLAAACGLVILPAQGQTPPLAIVATTGMVGDVAQEIGGACVAVTTLMGPGIDPHLYQATARDVQTLANADLILYSGFGLEGQLGDVLARFSQSTPALAVAQAGVPAQDLIADEDEASGTDPHLWMDPALWAKTVPAVAQAIAAQHPDCTGTLTTAAEAYRAQLEALDQWARQAIATIPSDSRILVTAHDAFAYFGRAYDIEVAGIQGLSTASEAAIADIRETAQMLAQRTIPAVFVESTINPRTIEAVIQATAQQGHDVQIGGQLYSDAMGDTDTPDGTYIGMIIANMSVLTTALGGEVPPLPDQLASWAERWGIETDR